MRENGGSCITMLLFFFRASPLNDAQKLNLENFEKKKTTFNSLSQARTVTAMASPGGGGAGRGGNSRRHHHQQQHHHHHPSFEAPSPPRVPGAAAAAAAAAPQPQQQQQRDVVYINPKQYHRILVRRAARAREAARGAGAPTSRGAFVHASRHEAALKRQRVCGKFLSKGTDASGGAGGGGGVGGGS